MTGVRRLLHSDQLVLAGSEMESRMPQGEVG